MYLSMHKPKMCLSPSLRTQGVPVGSLVGPSRQEAAAQCLEKGGLVKVKEDRSGGYSRIDLVGRAVRSRKLHFHRQSESAGP